MQLNDCTCFSFSVSSSFVFVLIGVAHHFANQVELFSSNHLADLIKRQKKKQKTVIRFFSLFYLCELTN